MCIVNLRIKFQIAEDMDFIPVYVQVDHILHIKFCLHKEKMKGLEHWTEKKSRPFIPSH